MNWAQIGAVAEMLGAIGVIASLVYLATEIRNQNRQSRLDAMHEISSAFREAIAQLLEGDIVDIFVSALDNFEVLPDAAKVRFIIAMTAIFRAWEEAYIQFDDGNLDARIWKPMTSHYEFIMSTPPAMRVWSMRKQHFDEKFRLYVDSIDPVEFSLK